MLFDFHSKINVYSKAAFYTISHFLFSYLDPILGPTSFQAALTSDVTTRQDELNSSASSGEADPNNSNQTVILANNQSDTPASQLEVSLVSLVKTVNEQNIPLTWKSSQ